MKKLLLLAALLSGCAAFQGNPSKFDKLQEKAECVFDVLEPYDKYFTEENLKAALAGTLDPLEVLKAMEVDPAEVLEVGAALKECAK